MIKIIKFKFFFIFFNKVNSLDITNIEALYNIRNFFISINYSKFNIFSPYIPWIGVGVEKELLNKLYINGSLNFDIYNIALANSFTSLSLRYYFLTVKYKFFFNNRIGPTLFIGFTLDTNRIKVTFDFFTQKLKRVKYVSNTNTLNEIVIKLKKEIRGENFNTYEETTEDILNLLPDDEFKNINKQYELWLDLFKFIHENNIPNCSYDEVIKIPQQIDKSYKDLSFIDFNYQNSTILITNFNKKNPIILNNLIYIDQELIKEKIPNIKLGLLNNKFIIKPNSIENFNSMLHGKNLNFRLTKLKQLLSFIPEDSYSIDRFTYIYGNGIPILEESIVNIKYEYFFSTDF